MTNQTVKVTLQDGTTMIGNVEKQEGNVWYVKVKNDTYKFVEGYQQIEFIEFADTIEDDKYYIVETQWLDSIHPVRQVLNETRSTNKLAEKLIEKMGLPTYGSFKTNEEATPGKWNSHKEWHYTSLKGSMLKKRLRAMKTA